MKEKTPLSHKVVARSCVRLERLNSRPQKSEVSKSNLWKNYFFLEDYGTIEGSVSHNVLYHQSFPFTRHLLRFYANNYFE